MTYCVALKLDQGIVFAGDTRTNAGVDNISCFRKVHCWQKKNDRVFVLLSAGNLSVTQSVVALIEENFNNDNNDDNGSSLLAVSTLHRAARIIGDMLREIKKTDADELDQGQGFNASFIFGGQIGHGSPGLFQIYSEGNYIEATEDTPFFQIGEHKYGKPIIDRIINPHMSLDDGLKLLLLSFDSTLRSNLSVGLPLDVIVYENGMLDIKNKLRIEQDDENFKQMSDSWSGSLRQAFSDMEGWKL
ncbi:MAG: peptidase [Methyloligellaceae bacterium]